MPKIKVTKSNPYGLSIKQQLVIADMLNDIEQGRGLSPAKSTAKIYTAKKEVANSMAVENLHKQNFRQALIDGLTKRKIIGKNSKVEKRLNEGLDAKTGKKRDDYTIRLGYIQEINKIAGAYQPERVQSESVNLNLNVDIEEEELNKRIEELQKELKP